MILYFSGTGNSKWIANKISKIINDNLIVDIGKKIKENDFSSIQDERIIFVVPTYAWRIPKLVEDYINKIKFINNKFIYFVMTCGGQIGNSNKYLEILCKSKNLNYMGVASLLMPDGYIVMFKPQKQEKILKLLSNVDTKLNSLVSYIKNNQKFPKERVNLIDRFLSSKINPQFYKHSIKKNKFSVNSNCILCGKCIQNCPLNNIELFNEKIVIGDNCTHCMKCISYCEKDAIQCEGKTNNKEKYNIEKYLNFINKN